jgi:hypothetical protein
MAFEGSNTCVFCGRPIGEGAPTAGRPPSAAHAACADAALTDDRHWDAIAAASGEPISDEVGSEPAAQRSGCLAVALLIGVVMAIVRSVARSRR